MKEAKDFGAIFTRITPYSRQTTHIFQFTCESAKTRSPALWQDTVGLGLHFIGFGIERRKVVEYCTEDEIDKALQDLVTKSQELQGSLHDDAANSV